MALTPLMVNLFIYIGQYTFAVYFTYLLLGIKINWKIIVCVGAFLGVVWVFLENYIGNWMVTLFIHWILFIAILSFLKVSGIFEISISVTVTTNIFLMYDHICINAIALFIKRNPQTLIDNSFMCCQIFALEIALATILYFLLKRFRLAIFE